MENKTHSIGQVLFVVLAKKNQVYPMQIVEVQTKKTKAGEEVRYSLQAGSDPSTTVFLDQIDGEVFVSAEVARTALIKRATAQVNKLVDTAVMKAKEWYNVENENVVNEVIRSAVEESESDEPVETIGRVVLPDGTFANIKLPSSVAG